MTETMIRERPILFSAPMIRAILDGSKTQTRRVVKPQPENRSGVWYFPRFRGWEAAWRDGVDSVTELFEGLCPYGQPGDRLWLREAWAVEVGLDKSRGFSGWPVWYRADDGYRWLGNGGLGFHTGNPRGRWRPSVHMPRWASRITLEITDVRVERVQEIGAADALAEGIALACDLIPRECFRDLWDGINGPRGHGWDANPWVWVLTFRRVEDRG